MIVPPPLRLCLDSAALMANWAWLSARSGGAACGAAVKADGYGLGARAVVDRLSKAGCRDFFCATWAEAAALGNMTNGLSIAVLHGVRGDDMAVAIGASARPVLNSAQQVALWRAAGGGRCDVMVDTGMNRLGLTPAEACSGLLDGLAIDTLMSHLACADEPDHPMNGRQLASFASVRNTVAAKRYSLANSAGILLGEDYGFDLCRAGIGLYGGLPSPNAGARAALRQVARIEAQILQVREVAAGATVGYGATWRAPAPTRLCIVNIGYADGILRQLGSRLEAIVAGERRRIAGRISMDLIAIDAESAIAAEGDWVEIAYDLPTLATESGLSQYELLTGLGERFERCWR